MTGGIDAHGSLAQLRVPEPQLQSRPGLEFDAERESLTFEPEIVSDTAALNGLVAAALEAVPAVRTLRDPTRGA